MRISRIVGAFVLMFGVVGLPLVAPPIASAASYTLSVSKSGSGTVASIPAGINCGFFCSKSFTAGTNVTLTATPSAGYTFTGWGGACSGTA